MGVSLFFDQGCAFPAYKEAVKLPKEYALSARLAFTKGGCRGLGMAKSTELKLPNWMVAASRTSALYRNYSKVGLARRAALRSAEGRATCFGSAINYPANEECLELPRRWGNLWVLRAEEAPTRHG